MPELERVKVSDVYSCKGCYYDGEFNYSSPGDAVCASTSDDYGYIFKVKLEDEQQ